MPFGNTRMTEIKVKPLHLGLSENVKSEAGGRGGRGILIRIYSTVRPVVWW